MCEIVQHNRTVKERPPLRPEGKSKEDLSNLQVEEEWQRNGISSLQKSEVSLNSSIGNQLLVAPRRQQKVEFKMSNKDLRQKNL